MAVTLNDLYPKDDWNYVFGEAHVQEGLGVFSFCRYFPGALESVEDDDVEEVSFDPTELSEEQYALFLERCVCVLGHELGHLFEMDHCIHFECLMNGINSIEENDNAPIHLCPICLRKLEYCMKELKLTEEMFDPIR